MDKNSVVIALEGLKAEIRASRQEMISLRNEMEKGDHEIAKEISDMRVQQNGRTKKLEHAVFGCEDSNLIGVCERMRRLESGWAKLTTGAVLLVSIGIEGIKWGLKALLIKSSIHP